MTRKLLPLSWSMLGFSLIEVLIALLVLSIGLLGLAALQTTGMKFNQQSYQRTQAVIEAYDIFDRIRANPNGKLAGYYDAVPISPIPSISLDCDANLCNAQQLATYDIANWQTTLAKLLAQGKGQIEVVGSFRRVTITWIENDLNMSQVFEAQL